MFKGEDQAMFTNTIEGTLTRGFVTLNAVIAQRTRTWLTDITTLRWINRDEFK